MSKDERHRILSPDDEAAMGDRCRLRNNIGFWLLGLCNNYAYVIMLSAAVDLLDKNYIKANVHKEEKPLTKETICNPVSTGAVLLANIVPALFIKLTSPFIFTNTRLRVTIVITLSALSFLATALSISNWMTYFGIICASLSSGLGEVTFLAFTAKFNTSVISTWSSGTGAAGLFGAFSYLGLTQIGVSPRHTLLIMLIIPLIMFLTYTFLIQSPPFELYNLSPDEIEIRNAGSITPSYSNSIQGSDRFDQASILTSQYTFRQKIQLIKPLLVYMIPLAMVYYLEYTINQGLYEVIYFPNAFLKDNKQQYRWYQFLYQLGVLISRSSLSICKIRQLWILPILQAFVFLFLLLQVIYVLIDSIYFIFLVIIFEGLLGGAAYVNTFYQVSITVKPEHKEFSMSIASLSDSFGITLSGFTAILIHNGLCNVVNRRYS